MINPAINVASSQLNTTYNSATEFPHIVFDNFINETILEDVNHEALFLVNEENSETSEWRMGTKQFDPMIDHPDQVAKRGIRELESAIGDGKKVVTDGEKPFRDKLRKI